MPSSKEKNVPETTWNVYKPGAFEKYEMLTKQYGGDIEEVVDNDCEETERMMKKVDSIQKKIKFEAFGKTKKKKRIDPKEEVVYRDTDVDGSKNLSMKQVEKLEEAISKVSSGNKGRCGKVFEMKTIVEGPKKAGQEALAVKNPSNGEVVVNSKEVKKVTLKYCLDVLNNNKPDDGVAESVKITNNIFKEIIKSKDEEFEVTEDVFEEVLNNLEKKIKELMTS